MLGGQARPSFDEIFVRSVNTLVAKICFVILSSGSKVWKEKPTLEGKVHGLFPPETVQQAHIIQLKLR